MTHMSKSIPKNDAWVINEYIFALHLKLNLQFLRNTIFYLFSLRVRYLLFIGPNSQLVSFILLQIRVMTSQWVIMPCKFDLGQKMSKMSPGKPFFTTFANICSFFALLVIQYALFSMYFEGLVSISSDRLVQEYKYSYQSLNQYSVYHQLNLSVKYYCVQECAQKLALISDSRMSKTVCTCKNMCTVVLKYWFLSRIS